jgi:hypothetical protein
VDLTVRIAPDDPELADSLGPQRVDAIVGLIHPDGLEPLDVGADRDVVAGEVVVEVVARGEHARPRTTCTSPESTSTRTSKNWAPKAWRESSASASMSAAVS